MKTKWMLALGCGLAGLLVWGGGEGNNRASGDAIIHSRAAVTAPLTATATVTVINNSAAPTGYSFASPVSVKPGTSVTWVNNSSAPHCIMWDAQTPSTSPPPGADIPVFSAGATSDAWIAPTVTVSTTYAYHCCIHGVNMAGQLIVTPATVSSVRFDFNGDGHPDLLWHNTSTGQVLTWNMNDQTTLAAGAPFATVSPQWTIAAVADVNADGHPDILWENTSTGQLLFWLMGGANGTTVATYGVPFATVTDTHWRVASMADFDGDGKPDILWQNRDTGQLVVWSMNGTSIGQYGQVFATVPDTHWQIVGTGDFNGDGHPDLLWQSSETGQVLVWEMSGTTVLHYGAPFAQVSNTAWHVVGTGDSNGDGHPDLIWENVQSGQVLRWTLGGTDGTTILQAGAPFVTVSDLHWQISGVH